MKFSLQLNKRKAIALSIFLAVSLPGVVLAEAAVDASDVKARTVLRQMAEHLANLKTFTVKTANTIEVVLVSGQKLQFDSAAELAVARPDRMRAVRIGDLEQQELVYDGKSLTVFNRADGTPYYATVAAPPTLEGALDFARESLDVIAPVGDLLYADAYNLLMEDVISGLYVGPSVVGGVRVHHLAFRGTQTDWQIWIDEGDKPLPRKMVITSKWTTGAPQYTVTSSDWNLAPKLSAAHFRFEAPKDAVKVDFVAPTAAKALPGKTSVEGTK